MFRSMIVFFLLVDVAILVQMFMRVVEMDMSLSDQLSEKIVDSEEEERPAGDAGKPSADAVTNCCAEQCNRQTESSRDQNMASAGECSYGDGLGRVPFLHSGGQDKGQPVRRDGGVEKGHAEPREREGSKDGLVHDAVGDQPGAAGKLTILARNGEDLSG